MKDGAGQYINKVTGVTLQVDKMEQVNIQMRKMTFLYKLIKMEQVYIQIKRIMFTIYVNENDVRYVSTNIEM